MAYAQEEGDRFNTHRIGRLDDIDDYDVCNNFWLSDLKDKGLLFYVNLEETAVLTRLYGSLPSYVGIVGFLSLEKYESSYDFISLHSGRRPRQNVHFFIDRYGDKIMDNMIATYKFHNEHVRTQTKFVIISSSLDLFSDEAVVNGRGRVVELLSPLNPILRDNLDRLFIL
ncbi:uncharacterized protein LOC129921997 [Biomphalaria glabrata]|uniref:Uncharacterized protein LOC129921997 n=1 Tax=Biomphalaria glabrata TaxID=6526 RepID=A0A9W2YG31_BIOGL|nr:uncharacterized protein LOC129921997 [Biomphalaria glabrata]XP_055861689.1 uncharacterized protein LOC129921997 [Biomphalaria glabrata]